MANKSRKDLFVSFAVSATLYVLYWSFIGWQYFFPLLIVVIGFGVVSYLLFRFLPQNIAGLLSFFLCVGAITCGVAGHSVWHKSMVMIIPGYIPGVLVGTNQRAGKKKTNDY